MPTNQQIREHLRLPPNTKTRQVLNRAIRLCAPGGGALLDLMERMDYLRIQDPGNPHYPAEIGKLRMRRDQMVAGLHSGEIPLTPREGS